MIFGNVGNSNIAQAHIFVVKLSDTLQGAKINKQYNMISEKKGQLFLFVQYSMYLCVITLYLQYQLFHYQESIHPSIHFYAIVGHR